jgi:hypothetical protein
MTINSAPRQIIGFLNRSILGTLLYLSFLPSVWPQGSDSPAPPATRPSLPAPAASVSTNAPNGPAEIVDQESLAHILGVPPKSKPRVAQLKYVALRSEGSVFLADDIAEAAIKQLSAIEPTVNVTNLSVRVYFPSNETGMLADVLLGFGFGKASWLLVLDKKLNVAKVSKGTEHD